MSYTSTKDHLAIKVKQVPDIKISEMAVNELKYNSVGSFVAVSSINKEMVLLETNTYKISKKISLTDGHIDWDLNGKYIRAITTFNTVVYYDAGNLVQVNIEQENLDGVDWKDPTCTFAFTIQGVYNGNTNPKYISSVGKGNTIKILATANENLYLNLYNYPIISSHAKRHKYYAHSDIISKICFNKDNTQLYTLGNGEKADLFGLLYLYKTSLLKRITKP